MVEATGPGAMPAALNHRRSGVPPGWTTTADAGKGLRPFRPVGCRAARATYGAFLFTLTWAAPRCRRHFFLVRRDAFGGVEIANLFS